jgi:hypothetical protein
MATTCDTPGTASSRFRRSYSPKARTTVSGTLPSGDDSDNSMISPVMPVIGVISTWTPLGIRSLTVASRSPTKLRARKMSVPQSNST